MLIGFRLLIEPDDLPINNVTSRLLILSNSIESHKCDAIDTRNLLLSTEARNVTLRENLLEKEDRDIIGKIIIKQPNRKLHAFDKMTADIKKIYLV